METAQHRKDRILPHVGQRAIKSQGATGHPDEVSGEYLKAAIYKHISIEERTIKHSVFR